MFINYHFHRIPEGLPLIMATYRLNVYTYKYIAWLEQSMYNKSNTFEVPQNIEHPKHNLYS